MSGFEVVKPAAYFVEGVQVTREVTVPAETPSEKISTTEKSVNAIVDVQPHPMGPVLKVLMGKEVLVCTPCPVPPGPGWLVCSITVPGSATDRSLRHERTHHAPGG